MDVQLTYCLTPGIYRVEMDFTNGMIEQVLRSVMLLAFININMIHLQHYG